MVRVEIKIQLVGVKRGPLKPRGHTASSEPVCSSAAASGGPPLTSEAKEKKKKQE